MSLAGNNKSKSSAFHYGVVNLTGLKVVEEPLFVYFILINNLSFHCYDLHAKDVNHGEKLIQRSRFIRENYIYQFDRGPPLFTLLYR